MRTINAIVSTPIQRLGWWLFVLAIGAGLLSLVAGHVGLMVAWAGLAIVAGFAGDSA